MIDTDTNINDIELTIKAQKRYLNIPVDNELNSERVFVYTDGQPDYYFDIQLANHDKVDFWVYMDIRRYIDCDVTFNISSPTSYDQKAFSRCFQSDEPKEAATFYNETKRPAFHFTSKRGWINDPNGLVYYRGEYHLFYQHNPYGWKWGNMHWGHSVSSDMIHWKETGDKLFPDELGFMFSGGAVVDWDNTSGLQQGDEPPIIAFYTAAGNAAPVKVPFTQAIACSNDSGLTLEKYEGNPVLENIKCENRDPKVIWHKESSKWIMALYLDGKEFCLLSSTDLKSWQRICDVELEGSGECPDFFPLAVDDDQDNIKWIFIVADGNYLIGDFDGTTFTPQTKQLKGYDSGNGYAGQSFSDIPESDGRRIHIAWLRDKDNEIFAGMPFNQQMTFPVEFTLRTTADGLRLFAYPIREIEGIYSKTHTFSPQELSVRTDFFADVASDALDIYAEFEIVDDSGVVGFEIRGQRFVYNCRSKQIEVGGEKVSIEPVDGKISMRILIDKVSVEFFAADGLVYMPLYLVESDIKTSPKILLEDCVNVMNILEVRELETIW